MAEKYSENDKFTFRNVDTHFAGKVKAHVQGKNEAYQRIQVLFDQAMDTYANGLSGDAPPPTIPGPSLEVKKQARTIRRIEDTESNEDADLSLELSSCELDHQRNKLEPQNEIEIFPVTDETSMSKTSTLSPQASITQHSNFSLFEDKTLRNYFSSTSNQKPPSLFSTEMSQTSATQASRNSSLFNIAVQEDLSSSENYGVESKSWGSKTGIQDGCQQLDQNRLHFERDASRLRMLEELFHLKSSKFSVGPSKKPGVKFLVGETTGSSQSTAVRSSQDHIFKITKPYHPRETPKFILDGSKLKGSLPGSQPSYTKTSSSRLSTSISGTKASRPFSAPKVPCYQRYDLTVPIPFQLTPHRRSSKPAQLPDRRSKIHALPVPLTSQLPLYDPEYEEAQRWKRRQARMEEMAAQVKPFNLHGSFTNLHNTQSTSMPNLSSKSSRLTARCDSFSNIEKRQELSLAKSHQHQQASPPKPPCSSASKTTVPRPFNLSQQKYCQEFDRYLNTLPAKKSSRQMAGEDTKWARTSTVPQPFHLSPQNYCQEFARYLATLKTKSTPSSPKKVISTKIGARSLVKLNQATALRNQAIRNRIAKQEEEAARQRRLEAERKRKETERMQDLAMILHAHGLDANIDSDKLLRFRELRLVEACREETYLQFLEEMKLRVEARPYILEQLAGKKLPRFEVHEDVQEDELEEKMKFFSPEFLKKHFL